MRRTSKATFTLLIVTGFLVSQTAFAVDGVKTRSQTRDRERTCITADKRSKETNRKMNQKRHRLTINKDYRKTGNSRK